MEKDLVYPDAGEEIEKWIEQIESKDASWDFCYQARKI
jgi:hypothetical protein